MTADHDQAAKTAFDAIYGEDKGDLPFVDGMIRAIQWTEFKNGWDEAHVDMKMRAALSQLGPEKIAEIRVQAYQKGFAEAQKPVESVPVKKAAFFKMKAG